MTNKTVLENDNKLFSAFQRKYEKVALIKDRSRQEVVFLKDIIRTTPVLKALFKANNDLLLQPFLKAAAMGLSLNPASRESFIDYRDGDVVFDITYQGLKRISEQSGVLKLLVPDNVFSGDTSFQFRGKMKEPDHLYDPFLPYNQRGEFRGSYCVATLQDATILTEFMPASDIELIKQLSKDSSWTTWFYERAKVAVIKRASKSWPKQGGSILREAVRHIDEIEGFVSSPEISLAPTEKQINDFSTKHQQLIGQLLKRAQSQHSWQSAKDYASSKFTDPLDAACMHLIIDLEMKKSVSAAA